MSLLGMPVGRCSVGVATDSDQGAPLMKRVPASGRTRENSMTPMEGRAEATDERSESARLPARSLGRLPRARPPATERPPRRAHLLRDEFAIGAKPQGAVACLQYEAYIVDISLPFAHRRSIGITNLLDRMFGEGKQRTKVTPHVLAPRTVLKLTPVALIRAAGRRGLEMTEFERGQPQKIRDELNCARAEHTKTGAGIALTACQS